jgi:hypothetical protein
MSLYADSESLPGDLLAAVEGLAPGAQGSHEFALDPAHYLDVTETTVLWDQRGPGRIHDLKANVEHSGEVLGHVDVVPLSGIGRRILALRGRRVGHCDPQHAVLLDPGNDRRGLRGRRCRER